MTIVDTTKLALGILFALLGVAILVVFRKERGLGQRKQIGALLLAGSVVFVSVGLGWLDL